MEKPEALRLADELDDVHTTHVARNAAAELRRLHAENEVMRNVANRGGHIAVAMSRIADLEAQRDVLLIAMKLIQHATSPTPNDGGHHEAAHDISSAAIAAQWGYVPAEQAEPSQKFKPTPLTQEQMDAPLLRTMVPLTDEEIGEVTKNIRGIHCSVVDEIARAVEKASWEKNK